ncbi:type II secretion system inner membrane protein GspF [Myxococcota bacterium]|nr:type II secretion system inner membrane protein GspF [Myxococcota bacterium]MBU1537109.1 type II secretion system inner membrane protein GspF [Myxococcota bacterium]
MPVFAYKCLNNAGKVITGSRDADSEKSLRSLLRKEGLFLQEAKESSDKGKGLRKEINISFLNKVSVIDIALITRQLATLLRASVPLTESLEAITEQLASDKKRRKLGGILAQVKTRVNEGLSLAEALKLHPQEFDEFYVSMVRSGEAAGNLDQVLFSLTDFLEKQHKIVRKIKGAMTYPIVMVFITVVVIGILMTSVIPNVISVFEDTDQTLPWYTQFLISSSNFFSNYYMYVAIGFVASVWGFRKWKKSPSGRRRWDRILLSTPLVGGLVRKIAISRFSGNLSIMLGAGVPILQALEIVKSVMGNEILKDVVGTVEVAIKEGKSIASMLAASGEFPPLATHMIAIGEKSGQLEDMLTNVALAYDSEVDQAITQLTSMLEPLMIVIMGAIVAFVVFSILMPIMQMNNLGL